MSKRIKVSVKSPSCRYTCDMMFPIGMFVNRELQNAECGEIVHFDNWRDNKWELIHKRFVNINSSEFTWLKYLIFGYIRTDDLLKKWNAECILAGKGKNAFDKDRVLYCEFVKVDN